MTEGQKLACFLLAVSVTLALYLINLQLARIADLLAKIAKEQGES